MCRPGPGGQEGPAAAAGHSHAAEPAAPSPRDPLATARQRGRAPTPGTGTELPPGSLHPKAKGGARAAPPAQPRPWGPPAQSETAPGAVPIRHRLPAPPVPPAIRLLPGVVGPRRHPPARLAVPPALIHALIVIPLKQI